MPFAEEALTQHLRVLEDNFWSRRRPPLHLRDRIREGQRIQDRSLELFFVHPAFQRPGELVEESIAKVQCMVYQGVWRIFWQRASGRWFRYQPCPEAPSLCGSPARDRRRCQRLLLWLNFPHVTLAEQVCVSYPGQEVVR